MLKIDKMFPFGGPRTIIILNVIFIYLMILSVGNAQLTFQLMDSEINEVVFVNETDITFRCSFDGSETTDVTVRIEDPDGNILTENNQAMYAEYTIQKVTMDHGGVYTCKVTYMCVDGNNLTATATLQLNVQDDSEPRCFRNGTVGQPYKPGDWLLLSCYCREGDECRWASVVVVGSLRGTILTPAEEIENIGGKEIIRVLVNYTSDADNNNTRYDCFHSSQLSIRCEIGPLIYSSNDIVVNPFGRYTSLTQCSDLKGGILQGMSTKDMVTDTNNRMTDDGSNQLDTSSFSNVIAVITGCLASLLTIVVAVLVVYIFVLRRHRDKGKDEKRGEQMMKGNIHPHTRDDYSTAIYNSASQQSTVAINDMDNYESVTDDEGQYDTPEVRKTDVEYSSKIYLSNN